MKEERLKLQGENNRLTFEQVLAPDDEGTNGSLEAIKEELAALKNKIAPLQTQIDQLTRQFWVSKKQVKANKYDLSASRYRQVEQDLVYYEKPGVTIERMLTLEEFMVTEIHELGKMLND